MHRKRSIINFCSGILTYKLSFFLLFLSSIQLIAKDDTIFGSAEDYTTYYPLGFAAEFTLPVLAKNFTIPESWQLLATAQDGEISQFSIHGDWLAWSEKRLDPKTEGNRAESFFVRLYRKRIDSNEIETLRAPKYSNTWGEHFVLGDNGIVSYDYRGGSLQTLYVPGQKPFALHNEDYYGNKYTPIKIYQDVLFCVSKKRVSLIPFDGKPPDLKRIIRLEIEKEYYYHQTDLFWDGKHILYTQKKSEKIPTAKKFPKFISKMQINLFDTERKKTIWKDERILPENIQVLDLNSKYAYYYVNCQAFRWNFKEKIFRRPLKEPGKTEQIILPFTIPGLVDFSQERLLCIIRHTLKKDKNRLKCFAAEIDFKTGSIDTFDIPLSLTNGREFVTVKQPIIYAGKGTGNWYRRSYNSHANTWLPMTGDAKFSRLIVVFDNKIYLVPKIKTEEIEGLDWQPVDKENEK